ncbi:MAG: helix-turn-helix transcriptional regulator [Candidatus Kerfeldbacteria bacterium]|nr:helix-turn-helix transcriptional regulator [Candidatus Kerfeldbacteria bacterium]
MLPLSMKSYRSVKSRLLRNRRIKKAYHELGPEFTLVEKLMEKRIQKGLTQEALARRIGTKQSAISRLERGEYNPTLAFLRKVAAGLNAKLKITVT